MTLQKFFEQNRKAALCFSGGTDSAYLLYFGAVSGCDIRAYYYRSEFQPEFELNDAKRLVSFIRSEVSFDVSMSVIESRVLLNEDIRKNTEERCYFCKKQMFSTIKTTAERDGYAVVIDGTNASDLSDDRPGMKAKAELSILSPLLEAGITKETVRKLSREAGLFTWNKPSYACLATRIPAGEVINEQKLKTTERSEELLKEMGYTDFRIRSVKEGKQALLQIKREQMEKASSELDKIRTVLSGYYSDIILDTDCPR